MFWWKSNSLKDSEILFFICIEIVHEINTKWKDTFGFLFSAFARKFVISALRCPGHFVPTSGSPSVGRVQRLHPSLQRSSGNRYRTLRQGFNSGISAQTQLDVSFLFYFLLDKKQEASKLKMIERRTGNEWVLLNKITEEHKVTGADYWDYPVICGGFTLCFMVLFLAFQNELVFKQVFFFYKFQVRKVWTNFSFWSKSCQTGVEWPSSQSRSK